MLYSVCLPIRSTQRPPKQPSIVSSKPKALADPLLWLFCILFFLAAIPVSAGDQASGQKIIHSHAIAMHGDIKYPADFTHFDYTDPDSPKGGELRLATTGTFDSLNPFIPKGTAAEGIGLIYASLTRSSDDEPFTRYGYLAESMDYPEDRSWIIFNLRQEARFHDGTPITAEDVVFSFNTLIEQGSPIYRSYYADVLKVEALSPQKVRFQFRSAANPELALIIGDLAVLPKHFWKDKPFSESSLETPLGSGPYEVASLDPGRSISYARKKNFWTENIPANRGFYNFDVITYEYFRDETVALEALKSGDIDFRYEFSSKNWATAYESILKSNPLFVKQELPSEAPTGMQAFAYNLRNPLFKDARVRKALNYAFDFEWTNRALFYDAYTRTDSYFSNSELASSGLPSEQELALLEPYRDQLPAAVFNEVYQNPSSDGSGNNRQNLRTAKRLLEEAGWKVVNNQLTNTQTNQVFKFEILLVQPAFERIVNPFVKNLARLGIEVSVRTVDVSQYINRIRKFEFDMLVHSIGQSLSPGNEQRGLWKSDQADIEASQNIMGIRNPVVDELVELIINAPDRESLVYRTRALDRVLLHNYYVIPQYHNRSNRIAYWDKFHQPAVLPKYDRGFSSALMTWSIDPEKAARFKQQDSGQISE